MAVLMIAAYGSNPRFPKRMPGGIVALLAGAAFCSQDAPQSRQGLNPLRIQQKISDIQMLDPVSAEIYFVQ